jgi:histidinol-phosphatase
VSRDLPAGFGGDFGVAWSAGLRRGSETELEAWLALAHAACDDADAIARAAFRRDLEVTAKADRTFVTEADRAVERAIRERIAAAHPDHGLVGEEYGTEAGGAATRWYVDPIDGTHNFIRGVPIFATLIAVERDGVLQAGVISAPALRERWWARRGGGAWGRGADDDAPRRLRVSRVTSLADAQVFHGSASDVDASGLGPGFRTLLGGVWRERGFGDFWGYTLLAEGAAEAMIEVGLMAWDAAAPTVLVEEAGGRVSDFDGRRALDSGSFLATNGLLHDEILVRLRG